MLFNTNFERGQYAMNENITPIRKQERLNQPDFFTKRIGHTTYRVGVHFSETNTETARDKISRLIRNESTAGSAGKAVGK